MEAEHVLALSEEGKPVCRTKTGLGGFEPIRRTAANPHYKAALGSLASFMVCPTTHQYVLAA